MHTPNTVLGRLWQCASPHLLRTCKKTSSTHPYFKIKYLQSSFFLFSFPFLFQVVGRVHEQRCRISARLKIGKPCSGWGEETLFFRKYYLRRIVFFCASLCAQSQMALARVLPLLRSHCFAHRSAMSGVITFNEGTTMQHTLSRISTIIFSTSP